MDTSERVKAVAEAVVDVVGKGGVGVAVSAAVLTTVTGFKNAEVIELGEREEPMIDASVDVADAAQAHTALAVASTARPVTAPQSLRMLEEAAVLIATVESHK